MTLFGQTLDGQQVFGLVTLVSAGLLLLVMWRRDRRGDNWLERWRAARAKQAAASTTPDPDRQTPKGPWG